jgi:GNAT superfamily N-acetyltransferase
MLSVINWKNETGWGMPDLRPPRNQVELAAMHDLRDRVLFKGRGRSGYDRHHPDDQSPDNRFTGFRQDGELLGTLRVDFLDDETGALRLVAIEPRLQRRGIGRKMIVAAEQLISRAGRRHIVTNATIDAVQFYSRLGYEEVHWDDPGEGAGEPIVPMQKQSSP